MAIPATVTILCKPLRASMPSPIACDGAEGFEARAGFKRG